MYIHIHTHINTHIIHILATIWTKLLLPLSFHTSQAGGSGGKSSEEMVLELSADQESGLPSGSMARAYGRVRGRPWLCQHGKVRRFTGTVLRSPSFNCVFKHEIQVSFWVKGWNTVGRCLVLEFLNIAFEYLLMLKIISYHIPNS